MAPQNQPFSAHRGAVADAEPSCPDFEVTNARGVLLYTSSDLKLARKFARDNAELFSGLKVEEVIRTEVRRPVYTPRLALVRTP